MSSQKLLIDRFISLVEARYRDQPALSEYAAELGVSTSKLRHSCQLALGLSPIGIVHDRILSEAKRCLAYTGMSVSGIAHYLGFTDAAYFTRFFTRAASKTPTAFRRGHEHASL
jgi:AraC family transcriptional activator of pobA